MEGFRGSEGKGDWLCLCVVSGEEGELVGFAEDWGKCLDGEGGVVTDLGSRQYVINVGK